MSPLVLPPPGGAYRWYSADVVCSEFTAVFGFMVGSIFSARYSAPFRRAGASHEHASVHFALYERGVRAAWVVHEFEDVALDDDGRTLVIGESSLRVFDGGFSAQVRQLGTDWVPPFEVSLDVTSECPVAPELTVVEGLSHRWQVLCGRGAARLNIAAWDLELRGRASLDCQSGALAPGTDGLNGWDLLRTHRAERSEFMLRPWGAPTIGIGVGRHGVDVTRRATEGLEVSRTNWGLSVPTRLPAEGPVVMLESSPFFARFESGQSGEHSLGETADFARLHAPSQKAGAA